MQTLMKKHSILRALLSLAAVVAVSSVGSAGTINLNDVYNGGNPFMGNNVMFTDTVETNGNPGDPATNFYQDPIVLGDTLTVNPVNFRAEVTPGPGLVAVDSQLETVIMSKNGTPITMINFKELGDFDKLGNGFAKAELNYFFEILEVNGAPVGSPITGNGTQLFDTSAGPNSGIWDLGFDLDLGAVAPGATKVRFEFDNRLIAQAPDALSLAFIAKKQIPGIRITVPEPSSVFGMLVGLGLMLVRRGRK